jgi:hypothetical protein
MATLLKVLNNLADIKSAGGVALRVRTQARLALDDEPQRRTGSPRRLSVVRRRTGSCGQSRNARRRRTIASLCWDWLSYFTITRLMVTPRLPE